MNKEQKKDVVNNFVKRMEKAKALILADFTGISVPDITSLRIEMRKNEIEFEVIKNTLARRVLSEGETSDLCKQLAGPTAFITSEHDEVTPAKIISDFNKKTERLKIKAGFINGKIVKIEDIRALAKLPSKEVLLSQIMYMFSYPMQGLVNTLSGIPKKFLYLLNALKEKAPEKKADEAETKEEIKETPKEETKEEVKEEAKEVLEEKTTLEKTETKEKKEEQKTELKQENDPENK